MDKPQLATLIAGLERIKERPGLYIASELPAVIKIPFRIGFARGNFVYFIALHLVKY